MPGFGELNKGVGLLQGRLQKSEGLFVASHQDRNGKRQLVARVQQAEGLYGGLEWIWGESVSKMMKGYPNNNGWGRLLKGRRRCVATDTDCLPRKGDNLEQQARGAKFQRTGLFCWLLWSMIRQVRQEWKKMHEQGVRFRYRYLLPHSHLIILSMLRKAAR